VTFTITLLHSFTKRHQIKVGIASPDCGNPHFFLKKMKRLKTKSRIGSKKNSYQIDSCFNILLFLIKIHISLIRTSFLLIRSWLYSSADISTATGSFKVAIVSSLIDTCTCSLPLLAVQSKLNSIYRSFCSQVIHSSFQS
jgi:hypothetical protein